MLIPKETPTKKSLRASARRLFEWLGYRYIDRVLGLEGTGFMGVPDMLVEQHFETYTGELRDAPAALVAPKVLRPLVEEALAEAQLKLTDLLAGRVGPARALEVVNAFAKALDRRRFLAPDTRSFRLWVAEAVSMPGVDPSQDTREDEELGEYVSKLTGEERRALVSLERDASALRNLSPLAELPALRRLVLRSGMLEDLSPLARLEGLEELRIEAPEVCDLSPLASLAALRKLDLKVGASDLSPLASLRSLEEIRLQGCDAVADVAPISGLPALRAVDLYDTAVSDLEPLLRLASLRDLSVSRAGGDVRVLPRFVALTTLTLWNLPVPSLDFLGGLAQLIKLRVKSCDELTDVRALARLSALEEIDLTLDGRLVDVSPLRGLQALRVLNLSCTGIRSFPPLGELPALEELDIMCTDVHKLDGIEQARRLRKLTAGPSSVRDLRPLAALTELEELHLDSLDDELADLGPLRGLPRLRSLALSSRGIRDLSPLADVKTLERVTLRQADVESVAPLAELPRLRAVDLSGCSRLASLRPLAACPALEQLDCHDCDRLRGAKSLEELRRPPEPPARRFPSAGVEPVRGGTPVIFDARNHLPRRPPEGWSMPQRSRAEKEAYFLDAEGVTVAVFVRSPGDGAGDGDATGLPPGGPRAGRHLLVVHLAPRDRRPATDKKAARILRRFRACDPFVETRSEDVSLPGVPWMRTFLALAHPASSASWAAVRDEQEPIRIEPPGEAADAPSPTVDLSNHLPQPWPEGWKLRRGRGDAHGCSIETPLARLTAVVEPEPGKDTVKLLVGVLPLEGQAPWVGDEVARSLLAPFRARGPFEEKPAGPYADAPGFRLFAAKAR